jgi:hypothetical protein
LLGYPFAHDEDLTFVLPPGWQVAAVPADRTLASPFGKFVLEVRARAGERQVRVSSRTEISRYRIPPAEYGAFRAFLGQLDAALRQSIVVRKVRVP